ncbi:hypothetical protein BsWGS_08501 [Bradybaena similaris]
MLSVVVLLCLSALAVNAQFPFPIANNGQCKPGWTYIQGSCYVYGERAATWTDAQTFCAAAGGTLFEIETSALNMDLKREAMQRGPECVWLGAGDIFKQIGALGFQGGSWRWIHSGNAINTFNDFASGEPNNFGPGDYCLALSQRLSYAWATFPCDYKCKFICQNTR